MPSSQQTDLDNARHADQRQIMQTINDRDESPFLLKNLRKYHPLPILKKGKYWYVTPNQWPYDHTQYHFLIIHQEDISDLTQVTPEAAQELIELSQWLQQKYKLVGGALCMRFGDTNYTGGSVRHLHAQFIVPDIKAPNYQPVRFKIGKDADKIEN